MSSPGTVAGPSPGATSIRAEGRPRHLRVRDRRQRPPLEPALARARLRGAGLVRGRADPRALLQGARRMRGKRVLVLGIGNSATDLAVEASRNADATFLAMRRGAWIVPKYVGAKPTDELAPDLLLEPPAARGSALPPGPDGEEGRRVPTDYGLPEPDHKLAEAHPTVSSDLLPRLGHGDIEVKPNIARFRRRADGRVRRRHLRRARPDHLLHGLQDHLPVLRPRPLGRARQPHPALPPRRPPRARRPLLRRACCSRSGRSCPWPRRSRNGSPTCWRESSAADHVSACTR